MSELSVLLEEFAVKAKSLESLLQSHIGEIQSIVEALSPIVEAFVPGSAAIVGTVNEIVNAASGFAQSSVPVANLPFIAPASTS